MAKQQKAKSKPAAKTAAERSATWQGHHVRILTAFKKMLDEEGRKPTLNELKKATKLSVNTIHKHLKFEEFDHTNHPLRILTDSVLVSLAKVAMGGGKASVSAARLWMQVMEGWTPKTQLSVPAGDGTAAMLILPGNTRGFAAGVEAVDWEDVEQYTAALQASK